jgi:low temperature requirement protein LtrA
VTDTPAATAPPQPAPAPSRTTEPEERRTSPVELLWDLVFVFAITEVTTLLAHDVSWERFGQALLVLALVWWAWSAFVWAANAEPTESDVLRNCLLAGTVLIFISGLAVPRAFGTESLLFAATYAAVRFLHLAVYVDASRRGNASRSAIAGFAVTVVIGMALLIAGAVASGWARALLWTLAVAIDYAGPAWLTRERLRGLQAVAVAHFAERYGTFVIICLGESIVAVGAGIETTKQHFDAGLVLSATLPVLVAIGMWWTYFDRTAEAAQARLREHQDPVLAAADAYSYLHLAIVAGIVIFAGGVKLVVHDPISAPMPDAGRLAMCGGAAIYLLGLAAFRLRILGESSLERVGAAVALMVLYLAGGGLPAWSVGVLIAAVVGAVCALETVAGETPGDSISI